MYPAYNQSHKPFRTAPKHKHRPNAIQRMRWALFVLGLALSAGGVSANQTDFTLPSISDRHQSIRLADYRGKTVYLDFWSSWCLPCRDSLPLLGKLQGTFASEDFAILTVNLDAHPSDGRHLMEKLQIEQPAASDVGWRVAKQFGLEVLPAAFLIDADGSVRHRLPELNDESFAEVASIIDRALDGNSIRTGGNGRSQTGI